MREFRAWFHGFLEGIAGRELPETTVDAAIKRIDERRQTLSRKPEIIQPPPATDYGDYDGPGAPPPPLEFEPATTVAEPTPTQKKYAPRKTKTKAPLENTTPVAETPPYNPENPMVVRMG